MSAHPVPPQDVLHPDDVAVAGQAGPGLERDVPPPLELVRNDDNGSPPAAATWPAPLGPPAYHGLVGEIVRAIEPHSEADPAALLAQTLVAFGNCVGRTPSFRVEADAHYPNLYVLLVGLTSKSRKGSAWGQVRRLYRAVDDEWERRHIRSGLSSGEGLIWDVRDPIEKQEPVREHGAIVRYQPTVIDAGVADKRLLIFEAEFASLLRVMGRDGNTLSAVIRQAWDTGDLHTLTKNSPATATDAHVSLVGHITALELQRELTQTDAANGFLNRFLLVCVRRSKTLPEGGAVSAATLDPILRDLGRALTAARRVGEVCRDPDARALWADVYPILSEGEPGLLGAVISRAEAQVVRLSTLYALLDGSALVRPPHLEAALEVWRYAAESARFVFGDTLGNPVADVLRKAITAAGPDGLERSKMHDLGGRHWSAAELDRALREIHAGGWAEPHHVHTKGRPKELWRSSGPVLSSFFAPGEQDSDGAIERSGIQAEGV